MNNEPSENSQFNAETVLLLASAGQMGQIKSQC